MTLAAATHRDLCRKVQLCDNRSFMSGHSVMRKAFRTAPSQLPGALGGG